MRHTPKYQETRTNITKQILKEVDQEGTVSSEIHRADSSLHGPDSEDEDESTIIEYETDRKNKKTRK